MDDGNAAPADDNKASAAPLWTPGELLAATGGVIDGELQSDASIIGVSIDTRTIAPGELFVALKDQRDGHEFVSMAFDKGAALALVAMDYQRQPDDGALLRVSDPLQALRKIAAAARARLGSTARVVAVTGSAGKTTTKEMLRACFAPFGAVHASEKSYNNHWGVPLTLARMPADTDFAVIEIGMNHPGEIRPLSQLTRPHVALVTTVAAAHMGFFRSLEEIAAAKAEIFEGLDKAEAVSCAVLPRDNEQFGFLSRQARGTPGLERTSCFGAAKEASGDACFYVESMELSATGSRAKLVHGGHVLDMRLAMPGRHTVMNAAASIAAFSCAICGLDLPPDPQGASHEQQALRQLQDFRLEQAGRGRVSEIALADGGSLTLIDESYNANPASVRAALENLALYPGENRKIAVLGDMLELGDYSEELHKQLAGPLLEAGIDQAFLCGPQMKFLHEQLPVDIRGGYGEDSAKLEPTLLALLQAGDVVMIKGSLGSRMGPLAKAVKAKFGGQGRGS